MDISGTLAPNSDQLDAIDLLGGPQTFTITKVAAGKDDQPVNVHLAEFPRVWRPGKSMRRVLAACWGTDASVWVGRRVTLYCDESVKFGNDVVGGTRIAALSHIGKPRSIPLLVSRGKSATFKVQPLPDVTPPVDGITPEQTKQLADAMKQLGMTDRPTVLAYVNDVIGREVAASTDLTKNEAAAVITALGRDLMGKAPDDAELDYDPTTEPGWSDR